MPREGGALGGPRLRRGPTVGDRPSASVHAVTLRPPLQGEAHGLGGQTVGGGAGNTRLPPRSAVPRIQAP